MFEKVLDVFNYIFWFFILNLLFMLFNIPLILFFTSLGISNIFNYFPLFLLCLLPTMPTFTVLLYCMNKLMVNKGLSIMKDFIKGVKSNFMQALFIWFIELLIFLMLHTNIKFFASVSYGLIFVMLFASLTIVLFAITPYMFMLISRFDMKSTEILNTAFILCFTKPVLTITNLLLLIVSLILFEMAPGTTVLFIAPLFAYLLTQINRGLFSELEKISKS